MIGLEQTGQSDAVQRNFNRLAAVVPDFGGGQGVSMRVGQATVTFTGTTGTGTVTHGLGKTPAYVLATPTSGGSLFANVILSGSSSIGASTFVLTAQSYNGTNLAGGTLLVDWLAIG